MHCCCLQDFCSFLSVLPLPSILGEPHGFEFVLVYFHTHAELLLTEVHYFPVSKPCITSHKLQIVNVSLLQPQLQWQSCVKGSRSL